MKRVEMYGDQRDIVEWAAKKLRADGYESLALSCDALLKSYDAAKYDEGISVPQSEYDRGYAAGYEAGDRDCMQSWVRSNTGG